MKINELRIRIITTDDVRNYEIVCKVEDLPQMYALFVSDNRRILESCFVDCNNNLIDTGKKV